MKRAIMALSLAFALACTAVTAYTQGEPEHVETTAEPTATPIPEPTVTPTPDPTATPVPDPTATPMPDPTATPFPDPTATPTPDPTATPVPDPTATPMPEPTATPTPEPTATPIPDPAATPVPDPTATPTIEPTIEPTLEPTNEPTPVPAKAYFDHDGTFMIGTPEELALWCVENGLKDVTIFLTSREVFVVRGLTEEQKAQFTFAPDRQVFTDTELIAIVSDTPPTGDAEAGAFYVWIGKRSDVPQPTPTPMVPTDEPTTEPTTEPTSEPTTEPTSEPTAAPTALPAIPDAGGKFPDGKFPGGKFPGGFGGPTVVRRSVPHAASNVKNVVAYDGVALELDEENALMHALTLGGEELELTLDTDTGEGQFTAEWLAWNSEQEEAFNALLLSAAEIDGAANWTFTGTALRKLAASGLEFVALKAYDHVTILPTQGFLAGKRYNQLRTQGITGKFFTYRLCMDAQGGMTMEVSVAGETFAVTHSCDAAIYYENVYTGMLPTRDAADDQESGD